MSTSELIDEIQKLSVNQKFKVIEATLKSIKEEENTNDLTIAAEALYNDYATDKNLTAFTSLDLENFYEAK